MLVICWWFDCCVLPVPIYGANLFICCCCVCCTVPCLRYQRSCWCMLLCVWWLGGKLISSWGLLKWNQSIYLSSTDPAISRRDPVLSSCTTREQQRCCMPPYRPFFGESSEAYCYHLYTDAPCGASLALESPAVLKDSHLRAPTLSQWQRQPSRWEGRQHSNHHGQPSAASCPRIQPGAAQVQPHLPAGPMLQQGDGDHALSPW